MASIIIGPHDDDIPLFCAFTAMRTKALTVICLDSYIQPLRGEIGCSAEERARETMCAHSFFRCETMRLRLRDDNVTEDQIVDSLRKLGEVDTVYAPADEEGGNVHHGMVSRASRRVFGDKLIRYMTYTRTNLYSTGNIEIVPTERELELKNRALACYESQIRINGPHFDAVRGKSEWLL